MRLPKSAHQGVGSSWTQSFTESHVQAQQLGHLIGPVGLFERPIIHHIVRILLYRSNNFVGKGALHAWRVICLSGTIIGAW